MATKQTVNSSYIEVKDKKGTVILNYPIGANEPHITSIGTGDSNEIRLEDNTGNIAFLHMQVIRTSDEGYQVVNFSGQIIDLPGGVINKIDPYRWAFIDTGQTVNVGDYTLTFYLVAQDSNSPTQNQQQQGSGNRGNRTINRGASKGWSKGKASASGETSSSGRTSGGSNLSGGYSSSDGKTGITIPTENGPLFIPSNSGTTTGQQGLDPTDFGPGIVANIPSDYIGLKVDFPTFDLNPDQAIDGIVSIRNKGDKPEVQFKVNVEGLDSEFYNHPPGPTLFPDAETSIHLRLYHPKNETLPAGLHHFAVRITAPNHYNPEQAIAVVGVNVKPFYHHSLHLTPKK